MPGASGRRRHVSLWFRWYGVGLLGLEALLLAFKLKDGRAGVLAPAVTGLAGASGLLLALDVPVGRAVFIGSAVVQIPVFGLFAVVAVVVGVLGFMGNWQLMAEGFGVALLLASIVVYQIVGLILLPVKFWAPEADAGGT